MPMKNLSRTNAAAQARRLQANPALAPQSDEGRREVVDCILRHCIDVEHAARTMTQVLDSAADARSLTAEISAAAAATRVIAFDLPTPCQSCPDGDWVRIDRAGISSVARHDCPRGIALRNRDRKAWNELASTRKLPEFGGDLSRARRPEPKHAEHELPGDADWKQRAGGDG